LFWEGRDDGDLVGSYANWADDAFSYLSVGQDCAVFYIEEGSNGDAGQWDDVDCDGMGRVTCETW
jgi:hypothetical protein